MIDINIVQSRQLTESIVKSLALHQKGKKQKPGYGFELDDDEEKPPSAKNVVLLLVMLLVAVGSILVFVLFPFSVLNPSLITGAYGFRQLIPTYHSFVAGSEPLATIRLVWRTFKWRGHYNRDNHRRRHRFAQRELQRVQGLGFQVRGNAICRRRIRRSCKGWWCA